MKVTRNIGLVLLAAWLILNGLNSLFSLNFTGMGTLMALLALLAGAAILLEGSNLTRRRSSRSDLRLGMILLGLWLVLTGLLQLVNLTFPGEAVLLALLALAAGVLILLGR